MNWGTLVNLFHPWTWKHSQWTFRVKLTDQTAAEKEEELTAGPGSPLSPFLPFLPRLPWGPGGPVDEEIRRRKEL